MSAKRSVQVRGEAALAGYLRDPYVHMIVPNAEEGGYLAEVLELPGCISEGDTPEEAYRNLEEAMAGWIAASLETNRPIPEPVGDRKYSGHFPLRMSTELHRAAALRAMQEGVSLNQWLTKAITFHLAAETLADKLADQVAARVAERISVDVAAGLRLRIGAPTTLAEAAAEVTHFQFRPGTEPRPATGMDPSVYRRLRESLVAAHEPLLT
jgi:antitoxin HicB